MKPETCAKLAGQAADYYRGALLAFSDKAWADIDAEFPYSLWLRMYACTFDAASFYQVGGLRQGVAHC